MLPFMALFILVRLSVQLLKGGLFKLDGRVFPMTKGAFKQSWTDVRKRAGVSGLTFHDLRREAGSRFDEAGLTKAENDLMMGHANRDMTSLYISAPLKSIQDKLDRHIFKGLTSDEVYERAEAEGMTFQKALETANKFMNRPRPL